METKLSIIFDFLSDNRIYNHTFQEKYYRSIQNGCNSNLDKISALLYSVSSTQSNPNIDKLASFFKFIHDQPECMSSMKEFLSKINPYQIVNFENLFWGMKHQAGWGYKTAALFTKSIFHLHNGNYSDELKIWHDVPLKIMEDEKFFLPVDSVIIAIFKEIDNSVNWDFKKINNQLRSLYNSQDIEVWDDLWFWGFITQKGSGNNRVLEWNESKYWALRFSSKNHKSINEIKQKALKFISLL